MAIILVCHLLAVSLSAAYYLLKRGPDQKMAAFFLIMLFLPAGGVILFWQLQKPTTTARASFTAQDQARRHVALPLPPDVSAEVDVAPIVETLLVADYVQRRKTVLDLLKQDSGEHVSYINLALKNEDKETAHYAASSILHHKRKLDSRLSELSTSHGKNPHDITIAKEYEAVLQEYLETIDLDPADRTFYIRENIRVLETIYTLNDQLEIDALVRLLGLLLEADSSGRARELCIVLNKKYPDSEKKYLALLESYFLLKDRPAFLAALADFRNSSLFFSNETISVIRLWLSFMEQARPIPH